MFLPTPDYLVYFLNIAIGRSLALSGRTSIVYSSR